MCLHNKHLTDNEFKAYFISVVDKLQPIKGRIIKAFNAIKLTVFDTSNLDTEEMVIEQKMEVIPKMMQQCICENTRVTTVRLNIRNTMMV